MVTWRRGWGQSAMGICAFFYMSDLFGAVVFQRSMLNWEEGVGSVCHGYICILLCVKLIGLFWCSGFPEIYAHLGGYILSQCALHLKTWPICACHLKTRLNCDLGHLMPLPGGYILSQCALHLKTWPICALIWKLDLILLFATRCHYQGGISYLSVHLIWKFDLILLFITRCHYYGGYIWS